MILETYLLYSEYRRRIDGQKAKKKEIVLANSDIDDDSEGGIGGLIAILVILFITLVIAIACIFFLYQCIRKGCMSFFAFLFVIILLNIPFVNIAIIIILFFWWWNKCRGDKVCKN